MKHLTSRRIFVVDVVDPTNRRIQVFRYSERDQYGNICYVVLADDKVLTDNSSAESAMHTLSQLLLGTDPWNGIVNVEGSCYDPCEVRDINGKTL